MFVQLESHVAVPDLEASVHIGAQSHPAPSHVLA
jgi:hypothetical protein